LPQVGDDIIELFTVVVSVLVAWCALQ
jgi:hypothetical protein